MDVLSDVLRTVKMTGAFFFDCYNYAPWVCGATAVDIGQRIMPEAEFVIPFHMILQGSCYCEMAGDPSSRVRLEQGDIVVVPRGEPHFMMSEPGMSKPIDAQDFDPPPRRRAPLVLAVNGELGQGEVHSRVICGFLGCDSHPFNPLLDALPTMFRARTSDYNREWLMRLAQAAVGEGERDGNGAASMMAKLAELMFIEVVRQQIEDAPPEGRGWLAGLRDKHVGAALRLIHDRPAEGWTLESLALKVGLSRSVFAERFADYVGIPAIQYLARWRLTLASQLLDDRGLSVAQAGAVVGYESEAAFNRAFKKHVGTAPGAWRKERRELLQSV